MHIVILDGYALNPGDLSYACFSRYGTVDIYDRTPPELVFERIRGAELLLVNKVPIRKAEIDFAKNLKYIGLLSTGYDVVDIRYAATKGIPVCNVPGYGTDAVAQHTLALILELSQNVGRYNRLVQEGAWMAAPDYCFYDAPLMELKGKTLGILGCGAIGRAVARLGTAFGLRVIGQSPHAREGFSGSYVDFDTLLRESDILSLHCPATEKTVGIINQDTISRMKDGAMIINTARGALIVEEDLRDALESGKLSGAGLDVISREPMVETNPLYRAKNCIITPHVAWANPAARQRLLDIAEMNLKNFLGGKPTNAVNGALL